MQKLEVFALNFLRNFTTRVCTALLKIFFFFAFLKNSDLLHLKSLRETRKKIYKEKFFSSFSFLIFEFYEKLKKKQKNASNFPKRL